MAIFCQAWETLEIGYMAHVKIASNQTKPLVYSITSVIFSLTGILFVGFIFAGNAARSPVFLFATPDREICALTVTFS